jgi:hypothetical protein
MVLSQVVEESKVRLTEIHVTFGLARLGRGTSSAWVVVAIFQWLLALRNSALDRVYVHEEGEGTFVSIGTASTWGLVGEGANDSAHSHLDVGQLVVLTDLERKGCRKIDIFIT